MIQEIIFKVASRIFLPDLVKQMKAEGMYHMKTEAPVASLEDADFMYIEDNQADVTIVTFTGPDVLYMGHSKHHLLGVIKRAARRFGGANLVFLRDPQRVGFMLRPDGEQGGLEYYAGVVQETMERLGASHNVAIGASWGGSVAHYIAYRCGMDQVITFSALYNTNTYLGWRNTLKSVLNLKLLFQESAAYFEVLTVTVSTWWCFEDIKKKVKGEVPDLIEMYRGLEKKPVMTLYYGAHALPDAGQSKLMRVFPEVKQVPLPTGRHNIPGYLYGRKQLDKVIAAEISAAREAKAAQAVNESGTS